MLQYWSIVRFECAARSEHQWSSLEHLQERSNNKTTTKPTGMASHGVAVPTGKKWQRLHLRRNEWGECGHTRSVVAVETELQIDCEIFIIIIDWCRNGVALIVRFACAACKEHTYERHNSTRTTYRATQMKWKMIVTRALALPTGVSMVRALVAPMRRRNTKKCHTALHYV
jgi:hypothetical protein